MVKIKKNDRQVKKIFKANNYSLNYLLYLPKDYNEDVLYPLVLFLHGSGERGKNIEKVKKNGPPRLIKEGKEFPFILVSPQCPQDEKWHLNQLNDLVDEILNNYKVDHDRIYITGLSMGGYGAWLMAQAYPERFAAILPVCGGGDFMNACVIKHLPVWAFHGAKDKVVAVQESERMVDALRACGGNIKFTVYPETGHDSWTETYNNPEIYDWMLKQNRKNQIFI